MGTGLTVVVDYGLCNIDSMVRALEECGAQRVEATRDPRVVLRADRIVLPGVGTFEAAMCNLCEWNLLDAILEMGAKGNVPFLGACLGMQLMATKGTEGSHHIPGLGFVEAEVVRLRAEHADERIPHIGWNEVHAKKKSMLFNGDEEPGDFYFVHSFHVKLANPVAEVGRTPYAGGFTSVLELPDRPIFGTQFHPEKSQKNGFRLLKNFLGV